jgi:NADPH:quinone reductase-like Zn-dependent oxidoreductase
MILGPNAAPETDHMKLLTEKKAHVVVCDLVPLSAPNVPEDVKKNRLTKGLVEANKLMEQGKIKPHICKTLFLNEVIDELVALHNGAPALPGKVVVKVRMHAAMMVDKDKVETQCVPIPFPKPNQLLLEVASAGLNPVDWKVVAYNFFGWKLPHALGTDVAGRVRQIGNEVKDFKRDDRVVSSANLAVMGSFAEYCVVDSHVSALCGGMTDMDVAGSLPVAFLSAYEAFLLAPVKALMEHKHAKPTILIPGGGGGVGHMAVGLANTMDLKLFLLVVALRLWLSSKRLALITLLIIRRRTWWMPSKKSPHMVST